MKNHISKTKSGSARTATQNVLGGYSIIETMVAVSLFLGIVMFGMTSLLNANSAHSKSQNMRSVMDNLNFIMEEMSRNIRTGYDVRCFRKSTDPTAGGTADSLSPANLGTFPAARSCRDGWAVSFEYNGGNIGFTTDQWVYYLDINGALWKSANGLTSVIQLTPTEVVIDQISGFSILGAQSPTFSDKQQPLIGIKLIGRITYKGVVTPFSIQTSVSQRIIDT